MESSKRKATRAHLTLQQKAQLRAFLAANPNLPQFAVADWVREHFHVRLGRTTLYRIQSAPESAFSGNPSRKKLRRVKFPEFEQQLLQFYEERRARREDVSDDLLMRKAAECRAACGISDAELKLSNGWLYRFKIRHQLNNVPPQMQEADSNTSEATGEGFLALEETSELPDAHDGENEDSASLNAMSETGTGILSARALTTVQAPGFFNWEPVGEFQQQEFAVVADGVLVQQPGVYELTIQVQHSAPLAANECSFKVYCGDRVVGLCKAPARFKDNVASSMWAETSLSCDTQSFLRVEFLASGYAFTDSSLVVRRLQ